MKLFDVYPLYEVTPVRAKDVYVYDNNDIEIIILYTKTKKTETRGPHTHVSVQHRKLSVSHDGLARHGCPTQSR